MRIAHLILAHKNPSQLSRLVHQIALFESDVFVHIDSKSNINEFIKLPILRKCFFINKRVDIRWAGFGTIQATLNSFSEIISNDEYNYINVISGQDFPIKPVENFVEHLTTNRGSQFITSENIYLSWTDAIPRIERYFLTDYRIPAKYTIERFINAILPKRNFPSNLTLTGRSNWFTITSDAARYILNYTELHPEISKFFKLSWGADEIFFSSILYNSTYREKIRDSLIYVDWHSAASGHPKILKSEDFKTLITSDKFFARKFDESIDNEILLLLEAQLKPS